MQDSFIPVDARTKTHLKKKRCRKVSEEPAKLECADERDTPSIVEVAGQEFQAQTRQKKSKLLKSVHDTHDLVSTAKNLISDFEDIALVSSSDDSESTLSIDDVLDEKKYAPSTLVWARIQQNRAITMWPSEVIDPACGINVEVPECPSFLAGQKPQILVYYFGKKKFGWHEKSELKLFGEIDAENAKDGMSRSFQQAVNKALKKFKKVAQSSSQRMKTSLDAIQSKAIGCKSNVKQLKARRKKSAPNLLIEPFITSESSISLETQKKSRHAHIKCLTSTACASRKKTNRMKSIKSSRDMSKEVKGAANTKQQTTQGTEDIFLVSGVFTCFNEGNASLTKNRVACVKLWLRDLKPRFTSTKQETATTPSRCENNGFEQIH
jgi:hypothetical protein